MTLRDRIQNQWETDQKGLFRSLLRTFSIPYTTCVKARAWAYRTGLKKTHHLSVPVVAVGNLTVGGVGKTPLVEWIARFYIDKGIRTAVVSRGYGRESKQEPIIVSQGEGPIVSVRESGDEPWMLAKQISGLRVVVGADRVRAGQEAIQRCQAQIIILDDGFQHLRIARDLNLCAIDSRRPFGNGRLLPAGPLRENLSALSRADFLFFTNAQTGSSESIIKCFADVVGDHPKVPCAFGNLLPLGLRDLKKGWSEASIDVLRERSVVLLSGIGSPDAFEKTVFGLGFSVAEHLRYPDHFPYGEEDVARICEAVARHDGAPLLTTMKDAVRLFPFLDKPALSKSPAIFALEVGMEVISGREILANLLNEVLE